MFQIDLKSRKSIYEQVVDNCKALIINGILPPDSKMPSVRDLSKTLTVNPNTVQKAYRELENQGFIYTSPGLGSFVSEKTKAPVDSRKIRELTIPLKAVLDEMLFLGVSAEEIKTIVSELLASRGVGITQNTKQKGEKSHDSGQQSI